MITVKEVVKNVPKNIVIIGGGFGGVYTARYLANMLPKNLEEGNQVTLISRNNYFLFTPLLHEVATGGLGPLSVAEPLREMFRNREVTVIQGDVGSVDLNTKKITLSGSREAISATDSTNPNIIEYDTLVYAGGATTNFYNTPGAEQYSVPMKNLEDALAIRTRVINSFEQAIVDPKDAHNLLSFVVVGGGPTGVELAAELAEFVHGTMCAYYAESGLDPKDASVTLLSSSPDLLMQCDEALRPIARTALIEKGVKVVCGAMVKEVTETSVKLADGTSVSTAHVFWMAGVKPAIPVFSDSTGKEIAVSLDKGGRIVTDPYQRMAGRPEVFVLGDAAGGDGAKPMLAQVATQAARIVAWNILKPAELRPFKFASKGTLVSLGQWHAVGEIFGIHISGPIAWLIWRTVYLFKFITWRKRFKVASEWTVGIFSPRDITKTR